MGRGVSSSCRMLMPRRRRPWKRTMGLAWILMSRIVRYKTVLSHSHSSMCCGVLGRLAERCVVFGG